jgi:hypothetical protein
LQLTTDSEREISKQTDSEAIGDIFGDVELDEERLSKKLFSIGLGTHRY